MHTPHNTNEQTYTKILVNAKCHGVTLSDEVVDH